MSENVISYGGQAVISGVLIQSPKGWSVAVRNQNNEIVKYFKERTPLIRRKGIFTFPLIRGIGALVDSLYVGYQALTISDEIYYADEPEPSTLNKILNYLFIVSFLSILIAGPPPWVSTIYCTSCPIFFNHSITSVGTDFSNL